MDEQILKLLKRCDPDFLSGEEISRQLNVSRTAIWKRVKALRTKGYEIEASRRLGYRFIRSPDLLIPLEVKPLLKTKLIGRRIHWFKTIDSTNSKAYNLALIGAEEGEVVIAEMQEGGRGRLGRRWFSPPLKNIYCSVILRPRISPNQAPLITLMTSVATAEAVKKISGLIPEIKWPNDILIHQRKVAGILNEINAEMDRINFIILGIGLNVNMDEDMFPEEIRDEATSLKIEKGEEISRKELLSCLLQELENWYKIFLKEGGESILKAWRERAQIKGRKIKVKSFGEVLVGSGVDVDSDGALILKREDGRRRRVIAGDLEYIVEN